MPSRLSRPLRFPSKSRTTDLGTDEQLVSNIQQNDQRAWAVFLKRYTDLIYHKAWEFSQTGHAAQSPEDLEDEIADLYLFIAAYLKQSLNAFQGKCKPRTWVLSIISNRPRILKAYLLKKDPGRTDIRLPRVIASRPEIEQEIFKRLVWGLDPAYIAQDLNLPEHRCQAVEDLLAEHSPRVYERIRTNRLSRAPQVRLDVSIEEDETDDRPRFEVADTRPNPEQTLVEQESKALVRNAVQKSVQRLSSQERRILILLYNEGMTASEIVQLASSDKNLGLPETANLNRIYYLKDRALNKILDQIMDHLNQTESPGKNRRDLLAQLEDLLQEYGLTIQRASFFG